MTFPTRRFGRAIAVLAALGVLVAAVSDADAQRRRRRRRRSPPPVEAPADPPADPTPDDPPPVADASATPEADVEASVDPSLPPPGPDLAPLRTELASVLDDLVQTRGRITALGRQLFRTTVRLRVENRARDRQRLDRLALFLDGDQVFLATADDGAEDLDRNRREVYQGFAAPGPHVLRVEVDQRARRDRDVHYELRDTYRIAVRRNRRTDVVVVLSDDSNLAEQGPAEGSGHYEVRTRVQVRSDRLPAEADGADQGGAEE